MMPEKAEKESRSEKTRKRILASADQVFYQRGLRKVTVEELCAGMAISKRTFYKHFPDRDALVEAIIIQRVAEVGPLIMTNLNSDRPVPEILERHFDILVNKVFARVSVQMLADLQVMLPEVWERIETMRSSAVQALAGLIRKGQKRGAIRSDLDPEVLGKIIQAVVPTIASPTFLMAQGLSFEQIVMTMKRILLYGLLKPGKEARR
ncbi:MAG: TetR/AcrR family transcriptional regulator [Proteobacteria bacterium]|nr:TetR/AcrR family transcriptional regulator [Pseudomonadota bacterium]